MTPNEPLSPETDESQKGSKEVIDLQAPPLSDGMGSGAASGAGEPAWVTEDVPQDLSDPIGAHDEPEEPS